MIIRSIVNSDIAQIIDIVNKNYEEVMIKVHSPDIIAKFKEHNTIESWESQLSWKQIFVVENNGIIIATSALANFGDNNSPKYCISNFFVEPKNQNSGIGTFLFKYILKFASNRNITTLHVPSSRTGLEFYKKMGFTIDKLQSDWLDEITWMTKIIL